MSLDLKFKPPFYKHMFVQLDINKEKNNKTTTKNLRMQYK
ncbi:hypothetical protein DOY81_011444 [Sarcophaga bullata]|nr:hypothetical protein DOY81_011444 [Sarcophaga bullata]